MKNRIGKEEKAYIIVEATVVFPIMILIFMGLIMASAVLPYRAALQKATQHAATAIATASSDTWWEVSDNYEDMKKIQALNKESPGFLYNFLLHPVEKVDMDKLGASIEEQIDWLNMEKSLRKDGFGASGKSLEAEYEVKKYLLYNEVSVTATKKIKFPINIEWVGMSNDMDITVTSTAVINNSDEFIRGVDLAVDIAMAIDKKGGGHLAKLGEKWEGIIGKLNNFLDS